MPGGHAVSAHSVDFYAPDSEQAGLLARAQEIENLEKQLRAQVLISEQSAPRIWCAPRPRWPRPRSSLVQVRRDAAQTRARPMPCRSRPCACASWPNRRGRATTQLSGELAEVDAQLEDLQQRRVTDEARFEELDMQLADSQERHAQLDDRVMQAERSAGGKPRAAAQPWSARPRRPSSRCAAWVRASPNWRARCETADQQAASIEQESKGAAQELARLSDAAAQAGLQSALALKLEREQALGATRSEYDDLTAKLRASDERRLKLERELDPLRQRITDLQLKEQAARLGFEQYQQLLDDAHAQIEPLRLSIEEGNVRLAGLQPAIDRLNREIAALGAVNLAALDELTSARERKQFLDAQSADLNEAMTTLEDAIKKIDGETRELLSGTFNTVNEHFGKMFPELFGGGNARLVITGEEILDSGVQVIAQPPGKKNQTIHLLSGGEKALTAIALVFAIFQLNPAPFCLLDEVDAPLDDANTERYAKLVTSMSRETQFLFISHNKIAMEMAQQLIGVTMQEQGVSRIVAVDMDVAVAMAEVDLIQHEYACRSDLQLLAAWCWLPWWPTVPGRRARLRRARPPVPMTSARRAGRCDRAQTGVGRVRGAACACAAGAEKRPGLDALIDVIAPIALEAVVYGEAALAVTAIDPARRQQTVRRRRTQPARPGSGRPRWPDSATRRFRPVCSWPTAPVRSTKSSSPSLSSRPRRSAMRSMARPISRTCSKKWRVRASSTSSPAATMPSLASRLRAKSAAWSPGYVQQHAARLGFVARCSFPGAWCCRPAGAGMPPVLSLCSTPRPRWPTIRPRPPCARLHWRSMWPRSTAPSSPSCACAKSPRPWPRPWTASSPTTTARCWRVTPWTPSAASSRACTTRWSSATWQPVRRWRDACFPEQASAALRRSVA